MTKTTGSLVFVALGANLGDARRTVLKATERLRSFAASDYACSGLWQTDPVDCPPGSPPFINAVAVFVPKPGLTPEGLLLELQTLEREFGRLPKKIHNEPRALDLDLIAFGNTVLNGPDLILPHPRAHLRRFVLAALAEIAPDFVLPGQNRTVSELLQQLPRDTSVRRL